jgi:hypothetical protein
VICAGGHGNYYIDDARLLLARQARAAGKEFQ